MKDKCYQLIGGLMFLVIVSVIYFGGCKNITENFSYSHSGEDWTETQDGRLDDRDDIFDEHYRSTATTLLSAVTDKYRDPIRTHREKGMFAIDAMRLNSLDFGTKHRLQMQNRIADTWQP